MRHLPEFWTPEPVEAWRVMLRVSGLGSTGSRWVSPVVWAEGLSDGEDPADCFYGRPALDHWGLPAPAVDCTCGWYAWKTLDRANGYRLMQQWSPFSAQVPGSTVMVETWRVLLSGVMIEHEDGYRAQFVRHVECMDSQPSFPVVQS